MFCAAASAIRVLVTEETKAEKLPPLVVVADDDGSARNGLGTLLSDEGFNVLLAEDGRDNQLLITTYLVKAGATVKVVPDADVMTGSAFTVRLKSWTASEPTPLAAMMVSW